MKITVGVPVHAEPERLRETLVSLHAHAPAHATVVLLPDGPDGPTRAALASPAFAALPQLATDDARGGPACWNRLAAHDGADVVVLLESGALVTAGALDRLVAALADRRRGLAGPSTNMAWNEQGAFRGARREPAQIAATALEARRVFGSTVRSLAPLHSLGDFCFAVRRDVIDAVGAADEGYGLGPCWEMDYAARAARAGFEAVWVCGAFVHRAPFTARRRVDEARLFEASRRRYQDNLCGRRLRGVTMPYEAHCKGDECPDFAPAALVRVQAPLSPPAPAPIAPAAAVATAGDQLLVSCIMPTRDRRAWVPQAVAGFLRQDFTAAELVVVDDGDDEVRDLVPADPRVRYVRLAGRRTVGAKRNEACAMARGRLVAHWDDDDWYPRDRLRRQVEALQGSRADLCGTSSLYFYQPSTEQAWRYQFKSGGGAGMLVGTSLLYRRELWQRAPFADVQVGEDVRFVRAGAGALLDLADPTLAVATIHGANTSPRRPDGVFWSRIPTAEIHRLLGEDLPFFRGRGLPLISCIMPTFDRRAFVPLSLRHFAAQDWPSRELIVIDDGSEPVEDLCDGVPGVRYFRLPQRARIGAKRNLACREARGELIAHWDDDDWYGPGRLGFQARPILAGDADLTGLRNRFVLSLPGGDFWTTRPELHRRMFVGDLHGGTIMFRRSLFAEGIRYPDEDLAEDAALVREIQRRGRRILPLDNPGLFVYVRHGRNAWRFEVGRFLDPKGWLAGAAPPALSEATLDAYRAAAGA